jgi:CheY-like chemotaxis protein
MHPWDLLRPQSLHVPFPELQSSRDDRDVKLPGKKSAANKSKQPTAGGKATRVLLLSGIWEVALYRAEVMRGHGLNVVTPRSKEEAVLTIQQGEVDVVVLTYTLPSDTVNEFAELVRQYCPGCRLVAISETGKFDSRVAPDAIVIASRGPTALIDAIRRVTRPH